MSASPPLPSTIDQVVARLDAIVLESVATGSRLGYFAALYNRVTMAVRDAVRAGRFDDNARMERLDVVFANRYLAAYDQFTSGLRPTVSWQVAFDAAHRTDLGVLQHLLLGMNAHINLDLGIAAADVAPSRRIGTLQADFNRINDVLAALMPVVESQLAAISPVLAEARRVGDRLDNVDDKVGNFSMVKARDGAWRFAVRLADVQNPLLRQLAIGARDAAVATLGATFEQPGPLTVLGAADAKGIASNVRILAQGQAGIDVQSG